MERLIVTERFLNPLISLGKVTKSAEVRLTVTPQLTVVVMSILAGVGTAGVPGGSLPLIVVVLQSIGVPGEGIGIILGVDRILDMCRTVLNVSGDLTIATCVAASETYKSLGVRGEGSVKPLNF